MTPDSQPVQPIATAQILRENAPNIVMNILNRSSRDLQGYALPPKFDGEKYVIDVYVYDTKSVAVGKS